MGQLDLLDLGFVTVDVVHVVLCVLVLVLLYYCMNKSAEGFANPVNMSIPMLNYGDNSRPSALNMSPGNRVGYNLNQARYSGSAGTGTVTPWDLDNMGITSTTSESTYRQAELGF